MVLPLRTADGADIAASESLSHPAVLAPLSGPKLVVRGARLRNKSAAQESTRGFRSALQPTVRSARGTLQRVGFHACAAKAA